MVSAGLCRVPWEDVAADGALRTALPATALSGHQGAPACLLPCHCCLLLLMSFLRLRPLLFLLSLFLPCFLLCLRSWTLNPVSPGHYMVRVMYGTQICLAL